jgi:nucleoid-associated protein YgaU
MPLNRRPSVLLRPLAGATAALALLATGSTWAQNFPITPGQRTTAEQVAQAGVPLSELAPNAPDSYTIKRGDTLWAISSLFLKSPWRWPELWGMNLQAIRNPHLIYPGQTLYLHKSDGRATLSTVPPGAAADSSGGTIKVSPRTRYDSLSDAAIPPVNLQAIEAFLTEALIVDEATFSQAPRIVAAPENRVLLTKGDRAYARGQYGSSPSGTALGSAGQPNEFRVFRNAIPLKDPTTGEVLGYEAQYLGKAELQRGERLVTSQGADSKSQTEIVPATIDIVGAKEEMRVGDRLLPEPPRDFSYYVPSAPTSAQSGQIVSVYGNGVTYAGQNQVVTINRGTAHGVQRGHVLAIMRDANLVADKTDEARPMLRLPGERNGLMMVFRTFDKLSYALVLQVADGAKVGDRFTNP